MQTNNHFRFLPSYVALKKSHELMEAGCLEVIPYSTMNASEQLEANRGKEVLTRLKEVKQSVEKTRIDYSNMNASEQLAFNRS